MIQERTQSGPPHRRNMWNSMMDAGLQEKKVTGRKNRKQRTFKRRRVSYYISFHLQARLLLTSEGRLRATFVFECIKAQHDSNASMSRNSNKVFDGKKQREEMKRVCSAFAAG